VGEGSTFTAYLPATDHRPQAGGGVARRIHRGTGRILVLEDMEPMFKIVERLLQRFGYQVAWARHGDEAVEIYGAAMAAGEPFDLVILDLTIPGGRGGAETLQELLKMDAKVKAVVSSGYSTDPVMANYQEYGFAGVVPKPFTRDQMVEVLERLLGTME